MTAVANPRWPRTSRTAQPQLPEPADPPVCAPSPGFEIIAPRKPTSSSFDVRVDATGVRFRIEPMRYPRQPRLWCVSVARCSTGGMLDTAEPAWIGQPDLAWQELAPTIHAIRADLSAWLDAPSRRAMRRWMLRKA